MNSVFRTSVEIRFLPVSRNDSKIMLPVRIFNFSGTVPWVGQSWLSNDIDQIAYTNRPGQYWSIVNKNYKLYSLSDQYQYKGDKQHNTETLKEFAFNWFDIIKWSIQNNRVWKKEK